MIQALLIFILLCIVIFAFSFLGLDSILPIVFFAFIAISIAKKFKELAPEIKANKGDLKKTFYEYIEKAKIKNEYNYSIKANIDNSDNSLIIQKEEININSFLLNDEKINRTDKKTNLRIYTPLILILSIISILMIYFMTSDKLKTTVYTENNPIIFIVLLFLTIILVVFYFIARKCKKINDDYTNNIKAVGGITLCLGIWTINVLLSSFLGIYSTIISIVITVVILFITFRSILKNSKDNYDKEILGQSFQGLLLKETYFELLGNIRYYHYKKDSNAQNTGYRRNNIFKLQMYYENITSIEIHNNVYKIYFNHTINDYFILNELFANPIEVYNAFLERLQANNIKIPINNI